MADSLARTGQYAALSRAIAIEPRNDAWVARRAILRFESGDVPSNVETDLLRALASRPGDSAVLAALGLLYEQQGDKTEAEKLLRRAVAADHRFTPAWTLANFYYRTGEFGKMWSPLRACLALIEPKSLQPWSFDPAPIYALAWQASNDAPFILSLIPKERETLIPYLAFLTSHPELRPRVTAAAVWPDVIRLAQPADTQSLIHFLDWTVQSRSPTLAVQVWNDLIDRGLIPQNRLDPNAGRSLADPEFALPPFEHGFGWRIPYTSGVIRTVSPHSVSLDFTGTEPETFTLLSTYVPVLPGRKYHLRCQFEKPAPQGFRVALRGDSIGIPECKALECEFEVPAGLSQFELLVTYQRPAGAVRLRETVAVRRVGLELEK